MRCRVVVGAAVLISASVGAGAEVPLPVSPGGASGRAVVSGRCPTFHWTAVEGLESVDLAVYRVPEEEAEGPAERVLAITLPGSAHGWTPSLGHCLEAGGQYAWSVGVEGEWSEPSLIEIAERPSTEEVRDALKTLRRFLAQGEEGSAATAPDLDLLRDSRALADARAPTAEPTAENQRALVFDTTGIRAESSSNYDDRVVGVHGVAAALGLDGRAYGVVGEATQGLIETGVLGVGMGRGVEGRGTLGVVGGGTNVGGFFFGSYAALSSARALEARSQVCCNGGLALEHSALVSNTANGGDVLALQVGQEDPGNGTNFITFFGRYGLSQNYDDQLLAEIEGDGAGGVRFTGSVVSPLSDFAEYLPKLEEHERFDAADVVGLFAGRVSHRTRDADRVMVVSTQPVVAGGRPSSEQTSRYAPVALLGQVPVKVRGPVVAGDLLVPSGYEDGTAVAVAAEALRTEQAPLVIGRSLEGSEGGEGGTVKTLVGASEVAIAGALGAARQEVRLYRWLTGLVLLAGVALTVARGRFA